MRIVTLLCFTLLACSSTYESRTQVQQVESDGGETWDAGNQVDSQSDGAPADTHPDGSTRDTAPSCSPGAWCDIDGMAGQQCWIGNQVGGTCGCQGIPSGFSCVAPDAG